MKKIKIIICSLVGLILPKLAKSQNPMTLQECVLHGLTHSTMLQKGRLEVRKTNEKAEEIKGAWFPQVNAAIAMNDNLALATQILPGAIFGQANDVPVKFGTQYVINAGVDVSQAIYNPTLTLNKQTIGIQKVGNELNIRKIEEQLIYDITTAYYATQLSKLQRGIIQANLNRITKLVGITKVQLETGFAKKTDYNRLLVNFTNLETDLQNLDINISQQLTLLKFYMSVPQSTLIVLAEKPEVDLFQNIFTDTETITKNSIDYQLLEVQKKLNNHQVKQIWAGYLPTVGATLRSNYQAQQNNLKLIGSESKWFPSVLLAVNVNIPIFDGFIKKHKANQVKLEVEKLEFDKQILSESLETQNTNARFKIQLNQRNIDTQIRNMKLAEEVLSATQVQYEGGLVTLSELLNSENALKEAQTNYLKNIVQLKIAEIEMLKSSGNIREVLK